MIESFLTVGRQIMTLYLLMAVGFVLGRAKLIGDRGSADMSTLVMYIVSPCMLLVAFQQPLEHTMLRDFAVMLGLALLLHLAFIVLSCLLIREKDAHRRGLLLFSSVFSNCGFMGYPLMTALFGSIGVFYGSAYVVVFTFPTWTYGIYALTGDRYFAKGIDIGLHHYIGQRDDGILQTAGQTIGEDHTGHFRVKADLPPFHLAFAGNGVHQPPHAQEHADELRNDGGQRRAVHIHLKDGDKQNIQHHIGDGGDDKIIKRMAAVAHRLHHAAALVIHHQTDAAREVGADIGD